VSATKLNSSFTKLSEASNEDDSGTPGTAEARPREERGSFLLDTENHTLNRTDGYPISISGSVAKFGNPQSIEQGSRELINQAVKVLDGERAYNDARLDQHLLGIQQLEPRSPPTTYKPSKVAPHHISVNEENFYKQYSEKVNEMR
jgi:hypothetical protein